MGARERHQKLMARRVAHVERDAAAAQAAEMKKAARLSLLEASAGALADATLAPKLIDITAMPDDPGEARVWAAAQVADLLARVPGLARQTTPVVAPTNGLHQPPAKQLTPEEQMRAHLLAQAGLGPAGGGGNDYFSKEDMARHGGGYQLPPTLQS